MPELQRLYFDLNGMKELSINEIESIRAKAKDIFPSLKDYYYYTREEGINQYYKRFARLHLLRNELGLLDTGINTAKNRVLDMTKYALDCGPHTLHFYAFQPAVELLASEEQLKYWLPKINRFEITGAYVQTEMGHGSDVASLQTTATFDPQT